MGDPAFTTVWNVGDPLYGNGENTVDFWICRGESTEDSIRVDWGDGSPLEEFSVDGGDWCWDVSHEYTTSGDKTVKIGGNLGNF